MNSNDTLKGIVFGAVGGAVGTFCMSYYWKAAESIHGHDPRMLTNEGPPHAMDEISAVGEQAQEEEGSTAAVGRIIHKTVTGRAPSDRRKAKLSEGVHWSYGILVSSLYGAARGRRAMPDALGGIAFGTGLWAIGDELMVPLLGLSKGPTAYPMEQHAHRWGAHLFYGIIAAATTQGLFQAFAPRPTKREMVADALKTYVTWKAMKGAVNAVSRGMRRRTGFPGHSGSHHVHDVISSTKKLARSASNGMPKAVARETMRSGRKMIRSVAGIFS